MKGGFAPGFMNGSSPKDTPKQNSERSVLKVPNNPSLPSSWKELGNDYFQKKEYELALSSYERGLKLVEDSETIEELEISQALFLNKGRCYSKLNKNNDAIDSFTKAAEISEESAYYAKAKELRAECYYSKKQYKLALKDCHDVLQLQNLCNEKSIRAIKHLQQKCQDDLMCENAEEEVNKQNNKCFTIQQQRDRIKMLSNKGNSNLLHIISASWWNHWQKLPNNIIIENHINSEWMIIDNSNLLLSNSNSNKIQEDNDIITINENKFLPKLKNNLKESEDYYIINDSTYRQLINWGYKFNPNIQRDNLDSIGAEIYPKYFNILYYSSTSQTERAIKISCSLNDTIQKVKIGLSKHLLCQASTIRLINDNDEILNDNSSLLQVGAQNVDTLYLEYRLPNGKWASSRKINTNEINEEFSNNNSNNNSNEKDEKDLDVDDISSSLTSMTITPSSSSSSLITNKPKSQLKLCASCGRIIQNLTRCSTCKAALYCSREHQLSHWDYHKIEHSNNKLLRRKGMVGLQNLGNTCYMNASLQCLSFLPELRAFLISNDYVHDLNENNPLGYKGALAKEFSIFLKKLWFGFSQHYTPRDIRIKIAQLSETWRTTEQQDAQEFIQWLLDGIHEDLNRVREKPYYELKDSDGRDDNIVANEAWELHLKRNQSIIVDLFHGQLKSITTCSICEHESIKFDPFSVLSLPIPDREHRISIETYVFPKKSKDYVPYYCKVNVSSKGTIGQLLQILSERLNLPYNDLLACRINDHRFIKYYSRGNAIQQLFHKNKQYPIFVYEVNCSTIDKRKLKNMVQIRMNFRVLNNNDNPTFTYPLVIDLKYPVTGKNLYNLVKKKLNVLMDNNNDDDNNTDNDADNGDDNDNNNEDNNTFPINDIQMFVSTPYNDEIQQELIEVNDKTIKLTDHDRLVVTIDTYIKKSEYKLYINENKLLNKHIGNIDEVDHPLNIYDCLKLYTHSETLDDLWYCKKCQDKKNASKQIQLWRLPDILIIHLKRFTGGVGIFGFGYGKKLQDLILFPIRGLDLSLYVSQSDHKPPLYDLFAVVNHYGIMEVGHYTACARTDNFTKIINYDSYYEDLDKNSREWTYFDDEKIEKIPNENQMITQQAYILFYKRRHSSNS